MGADFFIKLEDNKVKCLICPHECNINPGKSGLCKVRSNHNGILQLDVYGMLSATHFDPIEKKPLYHFYPGKEIYSLGSLGCNFKCQCCQNHHISQTGKTDYSGLSEMSISDIIKQVKSNPLNIGVAYTYNEPVVWYEYMLDIAKEVRRNNYKNVVVSNGFINREPLLKLTEVIDAFNIDLKGFDDDIYKSFNGGRLVNILNSLQLIKDRNCHLEITFLVVTEINDDIEQFKIMVEWIAENLGSDIPLHISRYFPNFKFNAKATPIELILSMANFASGLLKYVYIGNLPGNKFQDTICPGCQKAVIIRDSYTTTLKNISSFGTCIICGYKIALHDSRHIC